MIRAPFASRYGYHPDRLLPQWRISDPVCDGYGSAVIIERATNLLVIVTGDETTSLFGPEIVGSDVIFEVWHSDAEVRIVLPRIKNRILIYDGLGTLTQSLPANINESLESNRSSGGDWCKSMVRPEHAMLVWFLVPSHVSNDSDRLFNR